MQRVLATSEVSDQQYQPYQVTAMQIAQIAQSWTSDNEQRECWKIKSKSAKSLIKLVAVGICDRRHSRHLCVHVPSGHPSLLRFRSI
jgi:hypothetical protein